MNNRLATISIACQWPATRIHSSLWGLQSLRPARPTAFTITSATIGFAPIVSGLAFATAAVTLTDGSPLIDGASMVGAFPGAHNYQAQYNGITGVFADLVPSLFAPPGRYFV